MFIHKLILENWRSHKTTEFKFGCVNLIRGANNSGKSSIAAAIDFLLTGRCVWTQEAGQGADRLITTGTRQSTISAEIGSPEAVNLRLDRFRTAAGGSLVGKMNGRQYAGKQLEELFEKKGWNRDVLSAALRSGRFLHLSPTDQKSLLADVLRPEAIQTPKEIQEAMAQCFEGFIIEQIDLEGARELEERATKLRAECTAALRELGEPEKVEERPKGAPTAHEVEKKLDALRSEQNSIVRGKEKMENAWADRSIARKRLPAQIELIQAKILPEADEKRYLEAIEHEREMQAALAELQKINIQIEEYHAQIKGAEKHVGKCPTCGHETDTDELVLRIKGSIGHLESRIPTLQGILDRYPATADARNGLRIHREAVTDAERLKKELAGLGDPKKDVLLDTKALAEKIEELEGRITKGQKVLVDIAAHEQRLSAYLHAITKRDELSARRDAADRLAKWTGPSGVQAQMAQGKLEPFCGAINAVLEKFGYAAKFELEPYSIRVGRVGGDTNLELGSLSESEQWRFSLGFQAALAKTTGLGLIVLDRADVLVGPNRGTALKTVLNCGLEQVFIMASVDSKAKLPDDFRVFDLELNDKGETTVTNG